MIKIMLFMKKMHLIFAVSVGLQLSFCLSLEKPRCPDLIRSDTSLRKRQAGEDN